MEKSIKILKIYKNTFRVNVYTVKPFRAIGLIDADIQYNYGIERVRLAFYRSSGTNGGKIRGLWYPLVGIKVNMGQFTEFSNMVNKIMEIIVEGDVCAQIRDAEYVDKFDVQKAILERKKRLNRIENKMDESLENGFTLIETKGSRVGVINGLSVLSTGEYSFGRPSRITVTTSPGNKGIVNIEREVNMSGPIHNKGVLILGGYLAENFAQEFPLSLNANICFEQNYGGVDGDSATGAELYALLSSLSKIPLKQSIAATGSMNQKGEIQVVGGISEKIEGFYSACKKQGLNDNQGVIIPKNNSRNLILSDEVTNAIEEGKFTIYTVERVEEAIEILMDVKFDEVKRLVIERLREFNELQSPSKK